MSVGLLLLVAHGFSRFLEYVEVRPGTVLDDPVLVMFTPKDVTWMTFGVIYAGLLVAILVLARMPARLMMGIQAYAVLVLLRTVCMYLVPLDPPPAMIPLRDPLVELFVGDGSVLTRDLFFSGHTSTLFLLSLVVPGAKMRVVFVFCTLLVGASVLAQHVHYTIDVIVAPVFSYLAFHVVGIRNRPLS